MAGRRYGEFADILEPVNARVTASQEESIERGFKASKFEIDIAPVFRRLPERIQVQASICFMALIPCRVMRQRLKLAISDLSPEAVLAHLRRIKRHTVSIDSGTPIHGVSTVQTRPTEALAALRIKKPTIDTQKNLRYW